MSIAYENVLKRLKEERLRLSWSQKEMSQCVRMNQSNYSKVELGLRRLNYYELVYLCESNIDVHYIYTSQKCSGRYIKFFEQCSFSELMAFIGIIYSIVAYRYRNEFKEQWKNVFEKVKYFPLVERNHEVASILLVLRNSVNIEQKKMANVLGVDVKKLRDLEKGRNLPDSELISRLYEIFYIPPATLLKDKRCMANEIAVLLDMMDKENEKLIFDIIQKIHHN